MEVVFLNIKFWGNKNAFPPKRIFFFFTFSNWNTQKIAKAQSEIIKTYEHKDISFTCQVNPTVTTDQE